MRWIHTADWHLGRLFHGIHLTEDQAHVLEQLLDIIRDTRPDALVIAGDIYDRAVPPPDAVSLLDDVLSRIVLDLELPVLLISGNHDSPDRLAFGSRLLASQGLHVAGTLRGDPSPTVLEDAAGPVHFWSVPYAEPAVVREVLGGDGIDDHQSAMEAVLGSIARRHRRGQRSVLIAHAFVAGGEESESERPLSVGGAGTVDASCFAGFHYVALGHLHRSQTMGGPTVRYSGSLLKYSFSEVNHAKSVSLVDMDAAGNCRVERIPLSPRRDLRRVEGCLEEILAGPRNGESREDYLTVTLHDRGAILDAIGKLREVYPNVLHIERPCLTAGGELAPGARDHRRVSDRALFASFFSEVTGESLTDAEADAYEEVVTSLRQREREAVR